MKTRTLALISLLFFAIDMLLCVVGFVYGFGIQVQNWWVMIGVMIFSRWFFHTLHRIVDIVRQKEIK